MAFLLESDLDRARLRADPLADAALDSLLGSGDGPRLQRCFRLLSANHCALAPDASIDERAFFDATRSLPAWSSASDLVRAQTFFRLAGPQLLSVLACGAMMEGLAASHVAQLLWTSGGLRASRLQARLVESARFVMDVCDKHALEAGGRGLHSIQKVRLTHALMRRRLVQRLGPGRAEPPINQEDMLGTVMGFSVVALSGLERLGLRIPPEFADSYLHLWLCVGSLMGVEDVLLPKTRVEANWLMELGRRRHYGRSQAGQELAQELLTGMARLYRPVPKPWIRATCRQLVGPEVSQMLGLGAPNVCDALVRGTLTLQSPLLHATRRSPLLCWIVESLGGLCLSALQSLHRSPQP